MFSINLVFVDAKTIRKLNKDYRGLDKATTVLSFYYGEGRPHCLGEIFICQSLAKKQGLKTEELIIHGYKSLLSQIPTAKNLRT